MSAIVVTVAFSNTENRGSGKYKEESTDSRDFIATAVNIFLILTTTRM